MTIKTYDSYKDSGVEWIGKIPSEWKIIKLKYLFNVSKWRNPTEFADENWEWYSPYLSMDNLRWNAENINYGKISKNSVLVKKWDLLILRDWSNAWEFIKSKTWILSSTMAVLTNVWLLENKYAWYFLKVFEKKLKDSTQWMWIPHVDWKILKNEWIWFPSSLEQQAIASYLDEKTEVIENLIKQKKKQIKLLEEKRTALINQAVTRWLDPDVELVDSGIEWIGKIPKGWEVITISKMLDGIKDWTHWTHPRVAVGVPLLSAKNIYTTWIDIGNNESCISQKEHEWIVANWYPKKWDILLTCVGTIGRSCVYEFDSPYSFQRSVCFIRLKKKYNQYYVNYFIQTKLYQDQLDLLSKTSAQSWVYMWDIKKTYIVIPNQIDEQKSISHELDKRINEIIQVENKIIETIKLLKEYKKSLISHVVTGKVKVF